jgi:hypothetical protein
MFKNKGTVLRQLVIAGNGNVFSDMINLNFFCGEVTKI